jgi:hypothetical protein
LVNELRVPPHQGQNQSLNHVSGQGHINVNLSPVDGNSPASSPISRGGGIVTSSVNIRSPTSTKTSVKSPLSQSTPLKFGWAEHVYGAKRNASLKNSPVESLGGQWSHPGSTSNLHNTRGAILNPSGSPGPVPLGFERVMQDVVSMSQRDASPTSPVVSMSAVSRKKEPCKPIFKRHSADLNRLIGSATDDYSYRNNRIPDFSANACGASGSASSNVRAGSGSSSLQGAGPSSLGANENVHSGGISGAAGNQQPSASNRKFLLQLYRKKVLHGTFLALILFI